MKIKSCQAEIRSRFSIHSLHLHNEFPKQYSLLRRTGQSFQTSGGTNSSTCGSCCPCVVLRRMPRPKNQSSRRLSVTLFLNRNRFNKVLLSMSETSSVYRPGGYLGQEQRIQCLYVLVHLRGVFRIVTFQQQWQQLQ